ncbi:hypothetical protein I8752_16795 [Nostocaceae cyanobacterium CENA369]|uniref:Uncharacterized protein n=1 Tax=Dendronalium phyllosphericum CENA369 TaxID=1725256 RepID=A0A8J7IB59_9NOST|nr:hypothetical protein [Dendronalium phyllosphericum]MBH8574652.1 hypothetical protein [Dendronalium phyllosphericum CENA369]
MTVTTTGNLPLGDEDLPVLTPVTYVRKYSQKFAWRKTTQFSRAKSQRYRQVDRLERTTGRTSASNWLLLATSLCSAGLTVKDCIVLTPEFFLVSG